MRKARERHRRRQGMHKGTQEEVQAQEMENLEERLRRRRVMYKKKQEVQAQETGYTEERHCRRQVALLRKPGPVNAAFFQRIGRE
jgi:hypothetical protein